jgi:hypothetical protein
MSTVTPSIVVNGPYGAIVACSAPARAGSLPPYRV